MSGSIGGYTVASTGVKVNGTTVMRNMGQLTADKGVRDRRIAIKCVHVERIICLSKNFQILKGILDRSYVPVCGRILYVCFALQNFRPNSMENLA